MAPSSSATPPTASRAPLPTSDLDAILTAQFAIAWAGEAGEDKRLGWWRSDLVSEFGGEDLFKRLLPNSWRWAVLQGAREAARRRDAELRAHDHNPDRLLTLFNLGFELDERVEERLQDLKRAGDDPLTALPALAHVKQANWQASHFEEWLRSHGDAVYKTAPSGRRLQGDPPQSADQLIKRLVAAHLPIADAYPLPHFHRSA